MTLVAAVSVYLTVLLWRPPGRWWVRRRLGAQTGADAVPTGGIVLLAGLLLVGGAPQLPALSPPRIVLAATVAAVLCFGIAQLRAARARRRTSQRRSQVVEVLVLMAAELRAGTLPGRSLAGLADDFAMLRLPARAAELSGDV
ncbi:MAG: hypothetical protein JWR55_2448, partial [Aeromicrobium sp.]|nr:hypothetical protein [Aeromicrobium sp.]